MAVVKQERLDIALWLPFVALEVAVVVVRVSESGWRLGEELSASCRRQLLGFVLEQDVGW